jgi:metal-sulfur cluster biosynthetic enzyme
VRRGRARGSGHRGRRALEHDARQPQQANDLDHPPHLGLGVAQADRPPGQAQAPAEHDDVEHERAVREGELAEIDYDVAVRLQRARQRGAAAALRRRVLVARAAEDRRLFTERDDGGGKLYKSAATLNAMPTIEEVEEALTNVIDPELGLDFVELGLVYAVDIDGGKVHVTFTLTTPACPIGPQVTEQIEEFVGEIDGVDEVTSTMVFNPPWTPDKMSEDAKFALGF